MPSQFPVVEGQSVPEISQPRYRAVLVQVDLLVQLLQVLTQHKVGVGSILCEVL